MLEKQTSSQSDVDLMRSVSAAIRVARMHYGMLEDRDSYVIIIGSKLIPVVNSTAFSSSACLSRALIESVLQPESRPEVLNHISPADPAIAMKKGKMSSSTYDSILFHELIHSQQILRMWKARNLDLSQMSEKDVVEGWRDRSIPMPKSRYVDEEYGSVHAEVHAYMMHIAYSIIKKGIKKIENGMRLDEVERQAMKDLESSIVSTMKGLRQMKQNLMQDHRFESFIKKPLEEHGLKYEDAVKKPSWRMSDREWEALNTRMLKRMKSLVIAMLRRVSAQMKRNVTG